MTYEIVSYTGSQYCNTVEEANEICNSLDHQGKRYRCYLKKDGCYWTVRVGVANS